MMKGLLTRIIIIALMQGFAYQVSAHVALDYPQGGETFTEGEFVIIQWHIVIPHVTLNFDLLFSSDGGQTWEIIQMNIPADQSSFQWVVPNLETEEARVSVIMDNEGLDYQDESMNFTIQFAPMLPFMEVAPSDISIECNANQEASIQAWLDNYGGAMAFGFCGDLTWTDSYEGLSNGCGATGTTLVYFTATDECGSTSMGANLTIVDTESPVLSNPANDLIVECSGIGNLISLNIWLANNGGAEASDACSNVVWTNDYTSLSNDCGGTGSSVVTFTATDECGNSVFTTATYSIEDNTSPSIVTAAQNTTIECGSPDQQTVIQNWLDSQGGATALDVCSNVTWTHNYSGLSDGCGAGGSATVIFTATDACGNNISTTATFTVEDRTAPAINATALDTVINCGIPNLQDAIQSWLNNHGGANASDICGGITWTNDYIPVLEICEDTGSQFIHFIASDECGNSSGTSAVITLLSSPITSTPVIQDLEFKISPNPVSQTLEIEVDENELLPVALVLFDMAGKQVLSIQENFGVIYIPVTGYAPGVYFLQIRNSRGSHTQKFVIN